MGLSELVNELGMSGEEALRVLQFARKHKLTVDVASSAIWTARQIVQYEIAPRDADKGDWDDLGTVVPYRDNASGSALLAAYLPPHLVERVELLAKLHGKPLAVFLEEAVLDLLDRYSEPATE
jgi:hypothetical protein